MNELRDRIEEARARAIPVPWTPPVQVKVVRPRQLHIGLVADVAQRQLGPCVGLLAEVGLRETAARARELVMDLRTIAQMAQA